MWGRRSVLAACTALSTTVALASIGSTAAEDDSSSSSSAGEFSDGWSSTGGGAGNARYLPLEGEFPEPNAEAWRYDADGSDEAELVAAVDDAVFVLTDGGEIHALAADDGTVEWETEVDANGRPTVFDGAVYLAGTNRVTALDAADGDVRWERELDGGDHGITNPTAAYGAIYVVADGTLYALEADDGTTRWQRERIDVEPAEGDEDGAEERSFQPETVAAGHGLIYALTDDVGGLAALDGTGGESAWAMENFDDTREIVSVHATADRVLTHHILSTEDADVVYHHDPETGEWWPDGGAYYNALAIAAAPERCVTIERFNLVGYEYDAGERWSHSGGRSHAWYDYGGCLIAGDTVIATVSNYDPETVVGIDLADGTEKWSLERPLFDQPYAPIGRLSAVDERTLYLIEDGELVALRSSDEDEDESEGDDSGEDNPEEENPDEDKSDETDPDDDCPYEDDEDTDCPDGGDSEPDGSDGDDNENDSSGDTDGTEENGNGDDGGDGTESNGDTPEPNEGDGMPGFTTGAGILGGAATLEWLRRKSGDDEPTGVDEPAE